ncbi:chromosome partitioning protein [Bacillus inaquosorum KCTC 13429]|uniref:Chromosome partitioning protein n=1 Tax=Bacillus inaquosorum KCTC 13429 TaxID=1236548 RepID=A0A9W5PDL1_9BACI|nr:chromosome partitioning protein [Bacillus inaquosorum KCTC 13429]
MFLGMGAIGAVSILLAGCGGKQPVELLHDSMEKLYKWKSYFKKNKNW